MNDRDIIFMTKALELAKQAAEDGETPVGAVIVKGDEIVGVGRNRREKGRNALYHAEIEAIDNACKKLGGWRLFECEMYVTLEPCPMCAGAIVNSRLKRVVFGASDFKGGACGSLFNMFDYSFNHKPILEMGVMSQECADVLKDFFQNLRKNK